MAQAIAQSVTTPIKTVRFADTDEDFSLDDQKLSGSNTNCKLGEQQKYKDPYKPIEEKSIVLLKDNDSSKYIYYDEKTSQVRNDATNDQLLTDKFLWEIKIVNFQQYQQYRIEKKRGYKVDTVTPNVVIKNVANSCYLRVNHHIDAKVTSETEYDDWGSDYPAYSTTTYKLEDKSKFEVLCDEKESENARWNMQRSHNSYGQSKTWVFEMVDKRGIPITNQILTFAKGVTGSSWNENWSLPGHAIIQVLFENNIKKEKQKEKEKQSKNGKNSNYNKNENKMRKLSKKDSQLFKKNRMLRSSSLKNVNMPLSRRVNYRKYCKFDSKSFVAMIKDETLKSQVKKGYIYIDNKSNRVCNDGTDNSLFTDYFLWDITVVNFDDFQKHKSLRRLSISKSGNNTPTLKPKPSSLKSISPIVLIKNIGSGCYLTCNNQIKVVHDDNGKYNDQGSTFEIVCKDSFQVDKINYFWLIDMSDDKGLGTMNLMSKRSSYLGTTYKPVKDQFLTFGKGVKIINDGKDWRPPKRSKLRIYV